MGSVEGAQIAVKVIRYVPFAVCGVIVVLSRTRLSERDAGAALLVGGAGVVGLAGWLARYVLEQRSPEPSYAIEPTAGAIFSIAGPSLAHDLLWAIALALAFAAVVRRAPPKGG